MINTQKKPVLWLHVGMPKTGTTAFQVALEAAGANLLLEGWLYPLTGRLGPGQHHFARAVMPSRPYQGDARALFQALENEARAVNAQNILVSSEDFFLDCDLEALKAYLDWADVKVLFYLRDAKSWINSYFAQYIKDPHFRFSNAEVDQHDVLQKLSHYVEPQRVCAFADVFGHDALLIREYDDPAIKADLVTDACNAIGLSPSFLKEHVGDELTARSNVSITSDELELVRLSNGLFSEEKIRDRWLYALQTVSKVRTDNKKRTLKKFDLGFKSKKNQGSFTRISSEFDVLVKYFSENHKEEVQFPDIMERGADPLSLRLADKPDLTQQQLVTMGAGLHAHNENFIEQFADLFGYIEGEIEQCSMLKNHPTYALLKKPWQKITSIFRRGPRTAIVDKNDIIVLSGAAADIRSAASRVGMLAVFELGLCEEKRLYIEVINARKKCLYIQITQFDDFLMLAAGLLEGISFADIETCSKIHLITRPIFPFQPMAFDELANDFKPAIQRANAPVALSFLLERRKKVRTAFALRFAKTFEPTPSEEDVRKLSQEDYGAPLKTHRTRDKWLHQFERTICLHSSSRKLPEHMSGAILNDETVYVNDLIKKWRLNDFHKDFLIDRLLPKAKAIRLYTRNRT